MWISKAVHKEMISELDRVSHERDEWMAKYRAVTENRATRTLNAVIMSSQCLIEIIQEKESTKAELKSLKSELNIWKQKYADEVQKRVDLISQMKG